MNFSKITRTCCSTELYFSILTHVNLSKSKHDSVKTFEKTSIKFHVPSLTKWQKVSLIFRNTGWSIADEDSYHFLLSKDFFQKHSSFTKIWSTFISFIKFLSKFYNQKNAAEIHLIIMSNILLVCVTNLRNDEVWR